MTSHHDEQKQRRELAGSTGTMTYHSRALADLQLEQGQSGRFVDKAAVTGSQPQVHYPRLPEGNPWAADIVPPEAPLGYEINAQEAVGEPFEIAASLRQGDAAEEASCCAPLLGSGHGDAESVVGAATIDDAGPTRVLGLGGANFPSAR
jgi:hypothetical protein